MDLNSKDSLSVTLDQDIASIQKSMVANQKIGRTSTQQVHLENCIPFCSLAVPRLRVRSMCGQCSKPAKWMCGVCKNAYYCSKEHILSDNVHVAMCDLMSYTRKTSTTFMITINERENWAKILDAKQKFVLNTFKSIGINSMVTLKFSDGRMALQQAVHYAKVIYGHLSHQLSELLIMKAECSLHMNYLHEAMKELNDAESCLLAYNGEREAILRGDMQLTLGLLSIAHGEYDQAAYQIAEALFLISFKYGPNSMKTSRLYFYMGECFHNQSRDAEAETFYVHSLQNYSYWLTTLFMDFYCCFGESDDCPVWTLSIPITFEADALYHIKLISKIFRNNKSAFGKCLMCLAILFIFKAMSIQAYRCLTHAKEFLDPDQGGQVLHVVKTAIALLLKHAGDLESGSKDSSKHHDMFKALRQRKPNLEEQEKLEREQRVKQVLLVKLFCDQGLDFQQKLKEFDHCEQDDVAREISKGDPFTR